MRQEKVGLANPDKPYLICLNDPSEAFMLQRTKLKKDPFRRKSLISLHAITGPTPAHRARQGGAPGTHPPKWICTTPGFSNLRVCLGSFGSFCKFSVPNQLYGITIEGTEGTEGTLCDRGELV